MLASEGREEVFPSVERHPKHFPWATILYACVIVVLVICYVLLNR